MWSHTARVPRRRRRAATDPTIEDRCRGRGGTVDRGQEPGVGPDSAQILDPESGGGSRGRKQTLDGAE
ncbi:hypothetical protein GW17_00015509 [Ensete ventricosum]|nr:hypothetical protein GW17_00015509 [Ensete ventricosum]